MSDLDALIERFKTTRILCVGDVMLDKFVYGSVSRISPEAPIPVLKVREKLAMLGGAGNVIRNVAALGGHSALVGVLGQDDAANELLTKFGEEANARALMTSLPGRRTSIKSRFIAGGQQLLRSDTEDDEILSDADFASLLARFDQALDDYDVVVLSDYAKGVLNGDRAQEFITRARAKGRPVVVDPKGTNFARYRGASLITPNVAELLAAVNEGDQIDKQDGSALAAIGRKLADACGIEHMLITRSEAGMTLLEQGKEPVHLAAESQEVFDVSGAGDTVVAAMALGIGAKAALPDAVALANLAAGIAVSKIGTAVVHPQELQEAGRSGRLGGVSNKVMDLQSGLDKITLWKNKGLKVGFTNGCFDLIHPGHVSLLEQAAAACDRLVVGLNSDASVKRLKGETRPVQNETARAIVMASLAPVDMVVIFEEDTPFEMIKAIKPEALVKGADYTIDTVVGADIVQQYGGQVVLANLKDGHSTTGTISRINNEEQA